MRFWATIRNPASSIIELTLPVRFRRVASGLIIESVCSTTAVPSFVFQSLGSRYHDVIGFQGLTEISAYIDTDRGVVARFGNRFRACSFWLAHSRHDAGNACARPGEQVDEGPDPAVHAREGVLVPLAKRRSSPANVISIIRQCGAGRVAPFRCPRSVSAQGRDPEDCPMTAFAWAVSFLSFSCLAFCAALALRMDDPRPLAGSCQLCLLFRMLLPRVF